VGPEDLSALRFERVWVREAVFVDSSDSALLPAAALQDLAINLGIGAQITEAGDRATVSLCVQVEPPAEPAQFVRLSATVEGAFSIADGADKERLSQTPGTFGYHCAIHPPSMYPSFVGSVVVTP
jgi:hypothetical protein